MYHFFKYYITKFECYIHKKKIFISKLDYLRRNNRKRKHNIILTKNGQLEVVKFKFWGKILIVYVHLHVNRGAAYVLSGDLRSGENLDTWWNFAKNMQFISLLTKNLKFSGVWNVFSTKSFVKISLQCFDELVGIQI